MIKLSSQPHHQTSPALISRQTWQCRPHQGMSQIRLISCFMWIIIFPVVSQLLFGKTIYNNSRYYILRDIIPLLHRSYHSPPTGQQQHQLVQPTALSDFFYSPATDSQLRLAERKQVNPDLPTYQVSTFNLSPTSQCLRNLYLQMLSSQPHPAVLRVRSRHSSTVARLRGNLQSLYTPLAPPPTVWSSKNPDIAWPTMIN